MRKLAVPLGTAMLIAAFSLPVYAMGSGMGGGGMLGGMMGSWGNGLGNGFRQWQSPRRYSTPSDETGRRAETLDRRYYEELNSWKTQIKRKENELDALLSGTDPDMEKVRSLHGEIRNLREKLEEEQRNHAFGAGNTSPNGNERNSFGSQGMSGGIGMGYGGRMEGDGWNR